MDFENSNEFFKARMKLNGTPPRHYMPLSQSQSDDEENANIKGPKIEQSLCKSLDVPHMHDVVFKDKIPDIDPKSLPMSPLRTLAFILSLCMCVAFISIFIWLIPCKPMMPGIEIIEKWSLTLQNIAFTTDIVLTNASALNPVILLGYSHSADGITTNQGILALQKLDGKKLWQLPLYSEPTSILCNSIDANNDGLQDCLVIGLDSLMTTIDINKGSSIWYIHNHSGIQDADSISLPVVLNDCDNDSVSDLVVSYAFSNDGNTSYLALVSGRTGEVIGSLIPLEQCALPITAQFSLEWKNRTIFILYCSDGRQGNLWHTYGADICNTALNRTQNLKLRSIYRNAHFSPDVQFKALSPSKANFVMAINGSKFAVLEPRQNGEFETKWLKTIKTDFPWRVMAHGNYIDNKNPELLLLKSNNLSSQVIGLSIFNGQELWSESFNGSIITSALMLQKNFDNVDGIVLKILRPNTGSPKKDLKRTADIYMGNTSATDSHKITKTIEEVYVLFQHGKEPVTENIRSEEITQHCDASSCQPDVYAARQTAAATVLEDGAVDMAVVFMNASSPSNLQTYVKLLRLKYLKHSRCMYKLGS